LNDNCFIGAKQILVKIINSDFSPIIHGYNFLNLFDLKLIVSVTSILKKHLFIGLCGGMVFSALDYFYSSVKRPDFISPNEFKEEFVEYLWKRQRDSVSLLTLLKLIYHGISSDKKNFNHLLSKNIPIILEKLNQNIPVPVVIVRNRFFENPTNNHQLLIVSCAIDGPLTHFTCYDPNYPKQTPLISVSRISGQEFIKHSFGDQIRGMFINDYKPKKPVLY
jgi:hypothetical protein